MEKKEFKKTLANTLSEYGFVTLNNLSRAETDDLIVVVATQKSNYDNCYYLNYGFLIKELSPDLINPKDNQCDVFGRLNITIDGEKHSSIAIERFCSEDFSSALIKSMNETIKPVLEFGLTKYFELYPAAISTIRLYAKKYLKI